MNKLMLVCFPFWFFSCGKPVPPIKPEGEIVLYPACRLGTALLWKANVDPVRLREAASKPELRDGDCMLVWAWDQSHTWKFLASRSGKPRTVFHESGSLIEVGNVVGDTDISTSVMVKNAFVHYLQRFDSSLERIDESVSYVGDSVSSNCFLQRSSVKGITREEVSDSLCEPSPAYEAWLEYLQKKGYLGPK